MSFHLESTREYVYSRVRARLGESNNEEEGVVEQKEEAVARDQDYVTLPALGEFL